MQPRLKVRNQVGVYRIRQLPVNRAAVLWQGGGQESKQSTTMQLSSSNIASTTLCPLWSKRSHEPKQRSSSCKRKTFRCCDWQSR